MVKKLGIIVPYRDREKHLEEFKKRMSRYFKNLDIPYEIIIVHQDNAKLFNRGMLLNIGFTHAEKLKCVDLQTRYSTPAIQGVHLANQNKRWPSTCPKEQSLW
jgi:hypothetical protein